MSKRVNVVEIEKKVEKKNKWNIKHLKIRKKRKTTRLEYLVLYLKIPLPLC